MDKEEPLEKWACEIQDEKPEVSAKCCSFFCWRVLGEFVLIHSYYLRIVGVICCTNCELWLVIFGSINKIFYCSHYITKPTLFPALHILIIFNYWFTGVALLHQLKCLRVSWLTGSASCPLAVTKLTISATTSQFLSLKMSLCLTPVKTSSAYSEDLNYQVSILS